jgi:hypothetical protein
MRHDGDVAGAGGVVTVTGDVAGGVDGGVADPPPGDPAVPAPLPVSGTPVPDLLVPGLPSKAPARTSTGAVPDGAADGDGVAVPLERVTRGGVPGAARDGADDGVPETAGGDAAAPGAGP